MKNTHQSKKKHIALLGDLHGHFELAFSIFQRWEFEHQKKLDLILQVGDFGVWPKPYMLDLQTYKFAQHDPDEISFPQFQENTPVNARFFDTTHPNHLKAPVIFIKGNHEDFHYLQSIQCEQNNGVIPVDYYERILYLPNGRTLLHEGITIGGIGGKEFDPPGNGFTRREALALENKAIDILLVHEPYKGALPFPHNNKGSPTIRSLTEIAQPRLVFCGHYHENGKELEPVNETRGYLLNAVNFKTHHKLNPNCIGILEWHDKNKHSFSFLNDKWLKEYTRDNYKTIDNIL